MKWERGPTKRVGQMVCAKGSSSFGDHNHVQRVRDIRIMCWRCVLGYGSSNLHGWCVWDASDESDVWDV